jgi:tetratricopeptide (TPR) repeat protein
LARTNLDDLQQPVGERHAPWPFRLGEWLASERFNRIASSAQRATRGKSGKASTRALQEWLEANPDIIALIPLLLDRGDPQGREFAFQTALAAELPELNIALRDFALSQRGPDSLRHQAATAANEAGLLPSGGIRLWLKGEWQDIMLMSFEISGEPDLRGHSPEVAQLAEDATLALHDKDYETAEGLIRQALELEPDAPDLQNNLAVAYSMSGRLAEAEEMVRQIHQQYPDYSFARLSMARMHIRNDEIDLAKEVLKPLLSQKKFHTSEFTQLCDVESELWIADGKPDAARAWLDLWADVDPDNPQLASRRMQLEGTGLLQNLEKLVGRFR